MTNLKVFNIFSKYASFRRYFFAEFFLGIALGTGHLTSLRFFGKIGFSEILFLLIILFFTILHLKKVLSFSNTYESLLRIYFLATAFFVTPIITVAVYLLTDYNSSPFQIVSFAMSISIVYLLIEARKDGFNLKNATLWFFIIYMGLHFVTYFIYPIENTKYSEFMYTGGANNPNQIVYYSQSLSLLLAVFFKKHSLYLLPLVILLTLQLNSDAYFYGLQLAAAFYVFFHFIYIRKYTVGKNLLIFLLPILLISALLIYINLDELAFRWKLAGGIGRSVLYFNALDVIKSSPIVGYGVGSFSGKVVPFTGTEAHSNIFFFVSQFGIFFTFAVYFVMVKAVFIAVNRHDFFVAAFMISFIITGIFHYTARHFIFWVEFSIFYYYVFYFYDEKFKYSKPNET